MRWPRRSRRADRALCRVDQLVLQVADLGGERARRVALGSRSSSRHHLRHQPLRVGRVVDGEVASSRPERLRLAAQDPHAGAWNVLTHMLRARPPTSSTTRSRISPAALLVKVIARTLARRHAAGRQQVGDAAGDDAGLARAGAGEDQQRAALVGDRLALGGIQVIESRAAIRAARAAARSCADARTRPRGAGSGARLREVGGQGGHRIRSYVRSLIRIGHGARLPARRATM